MRLSQLDNGFISEWYENSDNTSKTLFNVYFKPYLKNARMLKNGEKVYAEESPYSYSNGGKIKDKIDQTGNNKYSLNFFLDDGIFIRIETGFEEPRITVDLNSGKGPNRLGRDVYKMMISKTKGLIPLCEYDSDLPCTDSYVKHACTKKTSSCCPGTTCLEKIIRDGWQIKDDYPW